ncbi:MAG: hypothetical protein K9J12_08460 [Melioribacteraceae bacterium]|nr:hypothetical protein [Melioribacteraceae bacterium]MCF8264338.1 hypothetical protein [Melioribacteraceae bacterium]MCF8412003.1 hypothetical protein [Melioribacteraceae bacterium]
MTVTATFTVLGLEIQVYSEGKDHSLHLNSQTILLIVKIKNYFKKWGGEEEQI